MRRRRPRGPRNQASAWARGYTTAHQKLRARWKPVVEGGMAQCHAAVCLEGDRWIRPGTPWHLGHTPDRTAWTGPEHARCNESEGAIRGNRARGERVTGARRMAVQPSRNW
jgi:hypothetical protein